MQQAKCLKSTIVRKVASNFPSPFGTFQKRCAPEIVVEIEEWGHGRVDEVGTRTRGMGSEGDNGFRTSLSITRRRLRWGRRTLQTPHDSRDSSSNHRHLSQVCGLSRCTSHHSLQRRVLRWFIIKINLARPGRRLKVPFRVAVRTLLNNIGRPSCCPRLASSSSSLQFPYLPPVLRRN